MERKDQTLDLEVIDLGDASVETKGISGGEVDQPAGLGLSGILDS